MQYQLVEAEQRRVGKLYVWRIQDGVQERLDMHLMCTFDDQGTLGGIFDMKWFVHPVHGPSPCEGVFLSFLFKGFLCACLSVCVR